MRKKCFFYEVISDVNNAKVSARLNAGDLGIFGKGTVLNERSGFRMSVTQLGDIVCGPYAVYSPIVHAAFQKRVGPFSARAFDGVDWFEFVEMSLKYFRKRGIRKFPEKETR